MINGAVSHKLLKAKRCSSGISGGCVNPAVGIVQPVFQKIMNARIFPGAPKTQLTYMGAYVGAPLLGGIFAGVFSRYIVETMIAKADDAKAKEIELTGM